MASCTEKHNTVGHSIGRMLLRHGIHEFFGQGLPQGLSLPFEELGLRQIAYRTENGGGYMADGYACVSKRPGVMIAQNGPAATLVVAPLAEALKSSIPLVVMLQEIPLKNEDRNAFQEFDHVRLFSACSKWTRRVHTADRVEDYVDQAFAVACSGRPGPVVLLFPNDMLGMPAEPEKRGIPLGHYPLDPVMPPLDAVRGVAERLLSSRNPVIVAGGGVHLSSACAALAGLQEHFSLPVATTVMGKGGVDERHPLSLGVLANATGPGSAGRHQRPILEEADFILLVGTRTDQNATDSWTLYPSDAVFAHIDMDSGEVGRNYEAIRLVGDARLTLEALADVMKTMDGGKRRTARAALEARIAAGRAAHDAEMASFLSNAGEPLHPAQVIAAALQAVLTPGKHCCGGRQLLVHLGEQPRVSADAISSRRAAWPSSAKGLPMALGAAVAEPEASIYCITGDGGFAHVWSEMEVAARSNLKVTTIIAEQRHSGIRGVFESSRYGKEQHFGGHLSHRSCGARPGLRASGHPRRTCRRTLARP